MNREIKFRAKEIGSNKWVYGYYCKDYAGVSYITTLDGVSTSIVNENTLGQFTGLYDKNGKEIYDGDILKEIYVPFGSDTKIIEYSKLGTIVYEYNSFGFQINRDCTKVLDFERKSFHHKNSNKKYIHPTQGKDWVNKHVSFCKLEIVGNIHENPELLK